VTARAQFRSVRDGMKAKLWSGFGSGVLGMSRRPNDGWIFVLRYWKLLLFSGEIY